MIQDLSFISNKKTLNSSGFFIHDLGQEPSVIAPKHEWPCDIGTK